MRGAKTFKSFGARWGTGDPGGGRDLQLPPPNNKRGGGRGVPPQRPNRTGNASHRPESFLTKPQAGKNVDQPKPTGQRGSQKLPKQDTRQYYSTDPRYVTIQNMVRDKNLQRMTRTVALTDAVGFPRR
ncbi:hypothetical protein G5I_00589 [Acromyrmex echinatior]|uniref:Uncharacterized protein n=1 Tax=Acromyrmex echinatior TaxID=103372 RepID=F4W594_ACREC|nr:hypothetical protein G5I_00589 [Acromyrmex echinatior]